MRGRSEQMVATIQALESRWLLSSAAADAIPPLETSGPRLMEDLGRGVVAVRASTSQVLVSWRLLALDPAGIGFNLYRSATGAAAVKINPSVLTGGTNFTDTTANLAQNNTYHVRPVIGGTEQAPSGSFTLTANHATEPIVRVPLQTPLAGYYTKFVWVGDLDGNTEFDYIIDRLAPFDPNNDDIGLGNQFLEAYTRTGTRLWQIDLGPTSRNTYNIEPGAATLSVGNWDGVTVRDMDSDGKAEVLLKTANGVVFGDGAVLTAANNSLQYVSVINGLTGAERARIQFANDYISDGAMGMMFGVGSVDGVNPALYIKGKNRVGNGGFNQTVQAYSFDGTTITRLWKWNRGNAPAPDGHQIRIVDLDGDGRDEYCDIGFALNSDGTFRYSLQTTGGIAHGDRFHIADIDPSRPGLEGYGVQQNDGQLGQPNRVLEYYYDAATGAMIWQHLGTGADVGRGMAADIDPRFPGMEVWSFSGLFNASSNQLTEPNTSLRPWPQLGLWWDGDTMHELLNDGKFEYWDWLNPTTTNSLPRYFRASTYGGVGSGVNPLMYGDILGDWREEVIYTNSAQNELLIFTTPIASTNRIYTLAQNPAYRNGMTIKGYMQSHHLDYFLGDGMAPPPVPNIQVVAGPPAPQGVSATVAGLNQIEIQWQPSDGAATYTVRRSTTSGGPYVMVSENLAGTYFLDSTAANGTTYYYVVSATGSTGVGGVNSSQASATIPVPSQTIVYPAESATLGGGSVVSTTHGGFNGTGYVDAPSFGGTIQFNNVNGGQGGTATLNFRYALASGQATGYLYVNGAAEAIVFNSTGAWTTWSLRAMTVTLNPGTTNTIRLESIGLDLGNIDELQVVLGGDTTAPVISNSEHLHASSPNQLRFIFSESVAPSLGLGDLVVTLLGPDQTILPTAFTYDPATHTAIYTLPTNLSDGNYRATFHPNSVIDASGNPLGSAFEFSFFVLGGDANHDRKVDLHDLMALANNWMGTGKNYAQGDFNGDGLVDASDLGILAQRWQSILAEPPPPPSAAVATSAHASRRAVRTPTRVVDLVQ